MAKKDFTGNENIDRDKKAGQDADSASDNKRPYPEEAKRIGETEVKNAHASGDGSFGRNDGSLSDREEEEKDKGANTY